MEQMLETWGHWCRVGLGRPRVASFKVEGCDDSSEEFDEAMMMRLDSCIASLGKPTAAFIKGVYLHELTARDAAYVAGFRLEREAARLLLHRCLRCLKRQMSNVS